MLQGEKADTHILGCAIANQESESKLAAKEKRDSMPVFWCPRIKTCDQG